MLREVEYDSEKRSKELSVTGSPPAAFHSIQDRFRQRQGQKPKGRASFLGVNYLFDIPLETARSICGYRHDISDYDWGEAMFTRLEPIRKRRG